jgi:DNA-binding MarR family transcriptional regulator
MSSYGEQQSRKDLLSHSELRLLEEVDKTPDITQRELSKRIGIALGLTNILLRNMTQKGFLRVTRANWKRRLYTLTPEGASHRIRLMVSYVHSVLDRYRGIRQNLRDQLDPLALNEESRVAVYGTGDFAELIYLGLKELSINEIYFFEKTPKPGRRFLGTPVQGIDSINSYEYDRVVVAYLEPPDSLVVELEKKGVTADKLVRFFSDTRS